jgi:DNA-binding Lrp family transcriptional regulator
MHKLDETDLLILRMLQENGRTSNVDLAERAGMSAPPCLRRLRNLEESGYIESYTARLNAPALGFTVSAFVKVTLTSSSEADIGQFIDQITAWPHVREAYAMAGEADFILKIVAKDWDDYQNFVMTILPTAHVIGTHKSYLTVKTIKGEGGVPI